MREIKCDLSSESSQVTAVLAWLSTQNDMLDGSFGQSQSVQTRLGPDIACSGLGPLCVMLVSECTGWENKVGDQGSFQSLAEKWLVFETLDGS